MNEKRKTGEHCFSNPTNGTPRCIDCGCDEDDAFVGGQECDYKATKVKKSKSKYKFEAVKQYNGSWAVKYKANGTWFTAAETFCIDGFKYAKEMAEFIAEALNQ